MRLDLNTFAKSITVLTEKVRDVFAYSQRLNIVGRNTENGIVDQFSLGSTKVKLNYTNSNWVNDQGKQIFQDSCEITMTFVTKSNNKDETFNIIIFYNANNTNRSREMGGYGPSIRFKNDRGDIETILTKLQNRPDKTQFNKFLGSITKLAEQSAKHNFFVKVKSAIDEKVAARNSQEDSINRDHEQRGDGIQFENKTLAEKIAYTKQKLLEATFESIKITELGIAPDGEDEYEKYYVKNDELEECGGPYTDKAAAERFCKSRKGKDKGTWYVTTNSCD
jgi:hypothetical protein